PRAGGPAAATRRRVCAAIAPALHQPLPGRGRQLLAGDHGADREPVQPAQRDRHPPPSHGRQRAAGEGARWRLGRGRATETIAELGASGNWRAPQSTADEDVTWPTGYASFRSTSRR